VVQIDLIDDWKEDLLQSVGAMLIACAQFEYQVYIVAKRKDGKGLLTWMLANPDQRFGRYCCWLEQNCGSDQKLMRLVARARQLWEQRNGYVHAIWGLHKFRRVRWRDHGNAGISLPAIQALAKSVRKARDDLERLVPAA
jgi:hypothetical protein